MLLQTLIGGRPVQWDADAPVELSIALHLHPEAGGRQPRTFGAPAAQAEPYRAGGFVGDTRQGGSCNVEAVRIIPHCNGTHTECIGHVVDERVYVSHVLREAFVPCTVLSITPVLAQSTAEGSTPAPQPGDWLITAAALAQAWASAAAPAGFEQALVLRTLPHTAERVARDYDAEPAAYFTAEAMRWVVALGVRHLIVDLPSVDRAEDGGQLTAHRLYWGLPPGSRRLAEARRPLATISELALVPEAVADGPAILQLQIPAWLSDAAPSRLLLYEAQFV